ncbi:hypothetical protein BDF21DRAFT_240300 [Thamnidium elegans]|nr:hypothetical protein BDF21DRAFT_240300 [Thamnidium elegans]
MTLSLYFSLFLSILPLFFLLYNTGKPPPPSLLLLFVVLFIYNRFSFLSFPLFSLLFFSSFW